MTATKPILAVWLIFTQKEALISLVDAPNIVIDNRKSPIKDYLPNVSAMSEAPACTKTNTLLLMKPTMNKAKKYRPLFWSMLAFKDYYNFFSFFPSKET